MEPLGHTASLLSIEPIENTVFSERKQVFLSIRLEIILIFFNALVSVYGEAAF